MKKYIVSLLIITIIISSMSVSVFAGTTKLGKEVDNATLVSFLPTNIKTSWPVNPTMTSSDGYYLYFYEEENADNATYQEIRTFTLDLISDCTTDREKAEKIFEWVHTNIKYVYGIGAGNNVDNIYYIWNRKTGACECYSMLMGFMLHIAGISNATVVGSGHEWNAVFLDGSWTMVDATNYRFGILPDQCDKIEAIAFTYENMGFVIDSDKGVCLTTIGKNPADSKNITSATVPSFVGGVYKGAIRYCKTAPVLSGTETAATADYLDNLGYECRRYSGSEFSAAKSHMVTVQNNEAYCMVCGEKNLKIPSDQKKPGNLKFSMDWWQYGEKPNQPVITSTTHDISKAQITYRESGALGKDYGTTVPSNAGAYIVTVTLPENEFYKSCQASQSFMIKKGKVTGTPKLTKTKLKAGDTLADVGLTATEGTFSVAGTVNWVDNAGNILPDETVIENGKIYSWEFTPKDENYETLKGGITLLLTEQGTTGTSDIVKGIKNTKIVLNGQSGKGYVKLNWKKSKGYKVDGYQLYRSTKKKTGFKKITTTKKLSFKTAKGKAGERYYYKVRGYRKIKGVTYYTKWSAMVAASKRR